MPGFMGGRHGVAQREDRDEEGEEGGQQEEGQERAARRNMNDELNILRSTFLGAL